MRGHVHLKKKLGVTIAVLIALCLVTVTFVGAKSLYETKKVPKGERHSISEIIHPSAKWEKVVDGAAESRFMEGINFDRNGAMWMVSPMSNELLKVERNKVNSVEEIPGAVGAKFHKDGRLFITSITGNLFAYDPKKGTTETVLSGYKGLNDLVFDERGGLYFTDPIGSDALNPTGTVYYLNPETEEVEVFADGIAYPNGVAISADGNRVYISEFGKNRIVSAPSKAAAASPETPFVFAQFEGGIGPDGVAVDREGNLYVAHFQAGEIAVVDASGFKYGTIRMPEGAGTFTTNLAFRDGYLYVTESSQNEVWRIKVKKEGLPLYGSK